jgi:hypothetical protein
MADIIFDDPLDAMIEQANLVASCRPDIWRDVVDILTVFPGHAAAAIAARVYSKAPRSPS